MKNIKMNVNKAFLILATLTLVAFLPACSPEETEPEKTVDRSKLTDKDWYDSNGARAHYFHSDGTYKNSGTWSWYESGDSMQIIHQVLGTYNFYFDYITDTEMAAGSLRNGPYAVYTTSP